MECQLRKGVHVRPLNETAAARAVDVSVGAFRPSALLPTTRERRGQTFCFNSTMTRMVFCANEFGTANFGRWPILGTYVRPNRVVTGSDDGELLAMKKFLTERIYWVNEEIVR